MGSTRDSLVGLGVKVQQRKWLLNWIDKYRQGVDPYLIPPRPPKVREKKGKTTMQR